ncbi:Gustatory receptor 192 [Halyomorpha halys]|nr:Gustatory receptor 192 [Halyomorpha halys]
MNNPTYLFIRLRSANVVDLFPVPAKSVMRFKVEVLSIRKILIPFLLIGRFLGLYSCSMKTMKTSIIWSVPAVLWIIALSGNTANVVSYTIENIRKRRKSHNYVVFSEIFDLVQTIASLIALWCTASTWEKILKKMTVIESTLTQVGIPLSYKIRSISLEVAFRICCLSSIFYLRLRVSTHNYARALGLFKVVLVSWSELMNIALTTCFVQCYQHLNEHLSNKNVHHILSLEMALQEVILSARSLSNVRLLFRISTSYIISIIETYFFMSTWDSPAKIQYKLYHLIIPLYNLYEVSRALYIFHNCSEKATIRTHLNMKKKISYSACGVFPLDPTLIHSILASALNYLTILFQFSNVKTPHLV